MGLRTLRGNALQRLVAVIGATAFLLQGYNQSMMNGFLTLSTFLKEIPEVDTLNTTGAKQAHNAQIEGTYPPIRRSTDTANINSE
jgi:hypothetical protein